MKGTSEAKVRAALTRLAEDMPMVVYKPPDDARNWKPADFLVWLNGQQSAMIEVKDNRGLNTYPLADLRPNQRKSIHEAAAIGLPYWLVIWWRRRNAWTVSNAVRLLTEADYDFSSVGWQQLAGIWGVDCTTETLPSTIGAALRGELS